jgi:hypothetical protein
MLEPTIQTHVLHMCSPLQDAGCGSTSDMMGFAIASSLEMVIVQLKVTLATMCTSWPLAQFPQLRPATTLLVLEAW